MQNGNNSFYPISSKQFENLYLILSRILTLKKNVITQYLEDKEVMFKKVKIEKWKEERVIINLKKEECPVVNL